MTERNDPADAMAAEAYADAHAPAGKKQHELFFVDELEEALKSRGVVVHERMSLPCCEVAGQLREAVSRRLSEGDDADDVADFIASRSQHVSIYQADLGTTIPGRKILRLVEW